MQIQFSTVTLLFLLPWTATATDWPQWRGPRRDGISTESITVGDWTKTPPAPLWSGNVGTGCSSVVVAGGRLYAIGNKNDTDTVVCLDAKTGSMIWKYSYACPLDANSFEGGPAATPMLDGDLVFTLSRSGHLFCLRASTGKTVWA